jgi:hypothetical protein
MIFFSFTPPTGNSAGTAALALVELPSKGSRRLFELWKQIRERRAARESALSALDQLRLLLIRLLVPSL